MTVGKPGVRPARPYFSSGPCAKPPGWGPEHLALGSLGRSHRSKLGKARLVHAIDLTRKILRVPDSHRIGIVPASDTGAVEMALWSMLGARPVTMLAWESFGEGWVTDVAKQLKLDATILKAPYGEIPDLNAVDWNSDVVFTWNGTTSGAPRAGRRLDRRRPPRPVDRRRHLRRLRDGAAVGQARCRHFLLAESARRRGRARRA